jgi:hypothetical protein
MAGLTADKRYEGRDLAVTTDFRDVFGEIVVRHMGVADPKSIFPDTQSSLRNSGPVRVNSRRAPEFAERNRALALSASAAANVIQYPRSWRTKTSARSATRSA